jgi:predicted acylesterase/phospholipase RssA
MLHKLREGQEVCRALSLSGGGTKGAYEVGVLHKMARMLNGTDAEYDVVSGISIGAVNGAFLAFFDKGDELNCTDYLANYWLYNTTNSGTYKFWPGFEPYEAIFKEPSVLDTSPFHQHLIDTFAAFNNKVYKHFLAGAVDVDSGSTIAVDYDNLTDSEYPLGVLASTSIPVAFPYTPLRNWRLIDGGSSWNNNMVAAVEKCVSLGFDYDHIEVDVIAMTPDRLDTFDAKKSNTW